MKRLFLLVLTLFFLGCGPNLPDKPAVLKDFLVQSADLEKSPEISANTDFSFSQENFPDECDWRPLVRVVDGDTIVVDKNTKVRFIGIDTPETKHPTKKFDPRGLDSSKKLTEFLAGNKKVCLIFDEIGDEIDQYGRSLAYVFSERGMDVNAEMLKAGLAKAYLGFPLERKEEFRFYETEAKGKELGLWKK